MNEVVDLVDRAAVPRPAWSCEIDVRVDEELLGELDDGAVGAADVLAGAALVRRPETTWMMRSIWYGSSGYRSTNASSVSSGSLMSAVSRVCVGEPAAVLVEELAERLSGRPRSSRARACW